MAGKAEDLPLLKPLTEHATLSPYQKVAENGAVLVDDDGVNIPDRPGIGGTERGEPLYRNFLTMCVAFSLNHGCVVSCLAYSTTELGNTLGGVGSGVLYVFYALTAFFLSKPYVSMVGPKVGLLTGCGGYCVYVCGFLFAVLVPAAAWPVFLLSCAIGGTAGGLLWTSQGRYFARNAKLYSEDTGMAVEKVNATFAGVFATAYLGFEMVTKVLATLIALFAPSSAAAFIFTTYTVLAIGSTFVIALVLDDLQEAGTWDLAFATIVANSGAAARLVWEDPRLALMLPFQVSFGFCSSFVPYYIFGTVISGSPHLGSTYVGLLSAVIVLTGASMALPAAWAANTFGKPLVMSLGGVCLAFSGMALFVFSNDTLGTWLLIVTYLVVYGIGRGTWENTNKAVIADLFADTPDLSTSAFAAISFFNGIAAAAGFFSYSSMTRDAMAGLVMITALIAIACYLLSAHIHATSKSALAARLAKYNNT
jgi:hypothetical protein